jgi:CRP-like cAMP-binding protein
VINLVSSEVVTRWKRLLPFGEPRQYKPGHELFRNQASPKYVYLIETGFISLYIDDPATEIGRSAVWRGAGDLFGECAVIRGGTCDVTAITATACVLYRISAAAFLEALQADVDSALWMVIEAQNRDLLALVANVDESRQAQQRLEVVLWSLAAQQYGPNVDQEIRLIEYSPGNKELAGYVGVNPTYIPRLLGYLEREGLARRDGRVIVVSRPQDLFHHPDPYPHSLDQVRRWKAILPFANSRRVESGVVLFLEDEQLDEVYLIEHGFVDLIISAESGKKGTEHSILWRGSGQLLGASPGILNSPSAVTARTKTACLLHRLSTDRFLESLRINPSVVLWQLAAVHNAAIASLIVRAAVKHSKSLRLRLEYMLWQLASHQHRGVWRDEVHLIDFSPNNESLASYVGTEERYISDLMVNLKEERIAWRDTDKIIRIALPGSLYHPSRISTLKASH